MKPISVGDLVVVVRGIGCDCDVGEIYTVAHLKMSEPGYWKCYACGNNHFQPDSIPSAVRQDGLGNPIRDLKRIPPLDELEGEKRDEDLKEPA